MFDLYVYCRVRAVTNVGKTCGQTPCFILAVNMLKLETMCADYRKPLFCIMDYPFEIDFEFLAWLTSNYSMVNVLNF